MRSIRVAAFLALVAAAVSGLAACGGGNSEEGGEEPTLATLVSKTPRGIAQQAGLDGVHSGQLEATLVIINRTRQELVSMRLTGWFKGLGEGRLPQLRIAASSQGRINGRTVDFNGSLILLADQVGFIYGPAFKEREYALGKSAFESLRTKFEEAQDGGKGDVTSCLKAAGAVELADLIRSPKGEGKREEPDGASVFVVSGTIYLPALIDLLTRLSEDPACGAQMQAVGFPPTSQLEAAKVNLKSRVGKGKTTFGVDRRAIVHELSAQIGFQNQRREDIDLELDFRLREINKGFEAGFTPSGKSFDVVLNKFGVDLDRALQNDGAQVVLGSMRGLSDGMTGRLPRESRGDGE